MNASSNGRLAIFRTVASISALVPIQMAVFRRCSIAWRWCSRESPAASAEARANQSSLMHVVLRAVTRRYSYGSLQILAPRCSFSGSSSSGVNAPYCRRYSSLRIEPVPQFRRAPSMTSEVGHRMHTLEEWPRACVSIMEVARRRFPVRQVISPHPRLTFTRSDSRARREPPCRVTAVEKNNPHRG